MTLTQITRWLDQTLDVGIWTNSDKAHNGLQVARRNQEVQRIFFAVDACEQTFKRAIDSQADLLVVHHGLFWGIPETLTGRHYNRVRLLMENDLGLYACHLPLDAHPEVGNNAGIAKALGMVNLEPFGEYHGKKIGIKGTFPNPATLEKICETLFEGRENALGLLPFGPKEIRSAGIVSGGASREVFQAMDEGLDLFITGDADHEIFHPSQEGKIHVIFGGHYATETWGVRLLSHKMSKELGVYTEFLHVPTGL